jgi:hypothetical protein
MALAYNSGMAIITTSERTTVIAPGQDPTQLPNQPDQPIAPPEGGQPKVTPLAVPPIQLRSTYPAGMPPLGSAPKLFGKTPTSIAQIMFPAIGIPGTHFQGPLVSGPTPGVQGAAGSAELILSLQLDGSMGNFDLPIQFPGGSFLTWFSAFTYASGVPGAAVIELGTQQGGSDIGVFNIPALGAVVLRQNPGVQLPVWSNVPPLSPFQAWLHVGGNTASVGGVILAVAYLRLSGPWSGAK